MSTDQSPFEPQSLVGTTLDGRYVLTGHLATGGMGAVFRAQHVHLRKEFAVKVLRPDLTSSPDLVERFRREAEIASALDHDNIVKVSDFGRSSEGYLFLVMELLQGESLFERLRREGFLSPEQAVPILWQICSALEAAHARAVVHRDLKPENVFLAHTSSGREVTKILDFGIAKFADPRSATATQAGVVVGTPEYLAPEQAMGTAVDARADVYAVGLIAWRMLVGHHPFKAEDARGLLMMQATRPVPPITDERPDLALRQTLVDVVARACEKDPLARQQSAAELRDALAASLGAAFLMPPGATPAPAVSLDALSPVQLRELLHRPSTRARWSLTRARLLGLYIRGRERLRVWWYLLSAHARANRRPWQIGSALAAATVLAVVVVVWQHGRAASHARQLLASDRPSEAQVVLERALEHRSEDPELLLLRARALHRIGRDSDAVEAYAAARARGELDERACDDLVAALAGDRAVADRASRILREEGTRAIPAVLRSATTSSGTQRLRALALARDLGAEEKVDRVTAYSELLVDPDCDVRRAAARRLGELGDAAAVPALRRAAGVTVKIEPKGLFGRPKKTPGCGALEADAAARRIEAARLPSR